MGFVANAKINSGELLLVESASEYVSSFEKYYKESQFGVFGEEKAGSLILMEKVKRRCDLNN